MTLGASKYFCHYYEADQGSRRELLPFRATTGFWKTNPSRQVVSSNLLPRPLTMGLNYALLLELEIKSGSVPLRISHPLGALISALGQALISWACVGMTRIHPGFFSPIRRRKNQPHLHRNAKISWGFFLTGIVCNWGNWCNWCNFVFGVIVWSCDHSMAIVLAKIRKICWFVQIHNQIGKINFSDLWQAEAECLLETGLLSLYKVITAVSCIFTHPTRTS